MRTIPTARQLPNLTNASFFFLTLSINHDRNGIPY
jgi:hypothetical protein